MPKGSTELTNARREEIISACEKLYQTMSFKEITLKDIAGATSFTRTSIYNYFQTKEEIFLALMQKEYEAWTAELDALASDYTAMSAESFSGMLAHSLEKRSMLLKLLSMNLFDMEDNSRPECPKGTVAPAGQRLIRHGLRRATVPGGEGFLSASGYKKGGLCRPPNVTIIT